MMKTKLQLAALALALSTISSLAQGSLTPPAGAPAPVMKSLDQIEARTPLLVGQPGVRFVNGGYIITNSGSYYLTQNITATNINVVLINLGTNDVVLDLNGFRVANFTPTPTSQAIIAMNGSAGQKVTIRNGSIMGNATNSVSGIVNFSSDDGCALVENVQVYNVISGINLNYSESRNVVRNCTVEKAGFRGIVADVVIGCTVRSTVNHGILASVVSDCHVIQDAGTGWAIQSDSNTGVVNNSVGISVGGVGIGGANVSNSYGRSTSSTGISATVASNCTGSRSGGTAISAIVANGCYAMSGTNIITHKYNMP